MRKSESQKESLETQVTDPSGNDHNPGRGIYRRQLEKFSALTDNDKHKELREAWKEVAMGAALRAKQMVATCAPKDFGRLYQVIMSGAVAIDKAFPKQDKEHSPQLVINMFGSLGQRAAKIAMPDTPETITVQAKEVPAWPDSATTKTLSLPTNTETLPTTKLSTEPSKPLASP